MVEFTKQSNALYTFNMPVQTNLEASEERRSGKPQQRKECVVSINGCLLSSEKGTQPMKAAHDHFLSSYSVLLCLLPASYKYPRLFVRSTCLFTKFNTSVSHCISGACKNGHYEANHGGVRPGIYIYGCGFRAEPEWYVLHSELEVLQPMTSKIC